MSPKEVEEWLVKALAKNKPIEGKTFLIGEKEFARIEALQSCTFLPGSFDKRFVRNLATKALGDTLTLK